MSNKDWKTDSPARQGFYRVRVEGGAELVAEFREHKKGEGKAWWQWVTEDPTVEKHPVLLDGVSAYTPVSRTEVEDLLRRKLTRDERIQKSYEGYLHRKDDWVVVPQPERRRLKVGQPVLLGNLVNPVVAALHNEGQLVTIEYESFRKEVGLKDVACGPDYQTWHWMDTLPVPVTPVSGMTGARYEINYSTSSLDHIVSRYFNNGMKADPKYQRDYVWTQDDKDALIGSLMAGKDIGRFIFVRHPFPQNDDILDGKQRLDALMGFFSSQYPFKGVYWDELCRTDRYKVEGKAVQFAELDAERLGEVGLYEVFLDVNAAGVPQTKEHLAKVARMAEEARERQRRKPEQASA
jgi:hypothetical protein